MEKSMMRGFVKSASVCKPIAKVKIMFFDSNDNLLTTFFSNKKGEWRSPVYKSLAKVTFQKNGFITKELIVDQQLPELIRLLEDTIVGYQEKLYFYPGDKITSFIHSKDDYQATLFRCGYQVDKVLDVGIFPAQIQQVPDKYFVKEGLNWKSSFEYKIPDEAKPGLYCLRLVSKENDQNSYGITFLVSTKPEDYGKRSPILVLASSNNWQAYNFWGGRSRYVNFEQDHKFSIKSVFHRLAIRFLPEAVKPLIKNLVKKNVIVTLQDNPDFWQFSPLSIKRPHPDLSILTDDVHTPFFNHLAPGEWRLLAWLEREGFEYNVMSGHELHQNPGKISAYQVFILSTHCEYWTKEMYAGLKDFHKKGGSIFNLSGNSIFREIEYVNDYDFRCISLRFEKSAEDESQLIGVRFDNLGYLTSAPYEVILPEHWAFEGLSLNRGDTFAAHSLNRVPGYDGGSGWETDKLTKTAPKGFQLLAKGKNRRNGGSDMIIKEPEGTEGYIFSASSITFGGSLLIDNVCSELVKNIFKRVLKR